MEKDKTFQESSVNQYSTKRRTSVLYDFSSVLKARFYVCSVDAEGNFKSGANPVEDILYVQINPNTIGIRSDGARRVTPISGNIEGERAKLATPDPSDKAYGVNEMTLELVFDLYDEFSIGTMDGMLAAYTTGRNLKSKEATSLERLIELSKLHDKAVLFKWGPIEYFGAIDKVDGKYSAFSRFGDPLKAEATVTIKAFGYSVGDNGEITDALELTENDSMKKAFADFATKANWKETALLTAEIGATQALR